MNASTMTEFSRKAFDASSAAKKEVLCLRLGAALSLTMAEAVRAVAASLHDAVAAAVSALRDGGHDLWSYDEDDEFEVWGPNYAQPSGPGIVVTFRAEGPTEVSWSTHKGR